MNERQIHLRVKVKSLAAESKIIRSEAKKTSGMVKWGLNHHRKTVVRRYTRLNLLAYGLLKGIPYQRMERHCKTPPDFAQVAAIAERFGGVPTAVQEWISLAKIPGDLKAA